jgi:uncharacterized membrane protein (DUF2068 family)
MKSFDQWPFIYRALFTNAIAWTGVFIGLAFTDVKASARIQVYVAVFVIAFINLMFLAVRPHMAARRAIGAAASNPYGALYEILKERPLITALCIFQLLGACRATATTIQIIQTTRGDYVRSLPNTGAVTARMEWASVVMIADSALWFASAIGLWRTRSWAWWVALVLNALSAIVALVLQFAAPNQFLFDPLAMAVVIILVIQPVRRRFRSAIPLTQQPTAKP